jgi:hypothetical protein
LQWANSNQRLSSDIAISHLFTTMALPSHLRASITPNELELIASETLVDIIPSFSMGKIRLLSVSNLLT